MTASTSARVAFRVDASERIGGGHVMRCLTLADALARRGARATFIAASMPTFFEALVRQAGHRLLMIEAPESVPPQSSARVGSAMSEVDQRTDAARTVTALEDERVQWLVVDHYRLDDAWERVARGLAERMLVLDDLANRRHACDVILDHSFDRRAQDYRHLAPTDCTILTGGDHLLLRSEFSRTRPEALRRRTGEGAPIRLLISLGSTDLGGVTARVLSSVLQAGIRSPIEVVLGLEASSLPRVETLAEMHDNVRVHLGSRSMAALMTSADLAIGAGGMTMWERCCLGLPSLTVILADNQRPSAEALARMGAVDVIDDVDQAGLAAAGLLGDAARRSRMATISSRLVDGLGAERLTEMMLAPPLSPRSNAGD